MAAEASVGHQGAEVAVALANPGNVGHQKGRVPALGPPSADRETSVKRRSRPAGRDNLEAGVPVIENDIGAEVGSIRHTDTPLSRRKPPGESDGSLQRGPDPGARAVPFIITAGGSFPACSHS